MTAWPLTSGKTVNPSSSKETQSQSSQSCEQRTQAALTGRNRWRHFGHLIGLGSRLTRDSPELMLFLVNTWPHVLGDFLSPLPGHTTVNSLSRSAGTIGCAGGAATRFAGATTSMGWFASSQPAAGAIAPPATLDTHLQVDQIFEQTEHIARLGLNL